MKPDYLNPTPGHCDSVIDGLSVRSQSINACIGDITGNKEIIISKIKEAREQGVELIVFPELALTGYPPEDLLLHVLDLQGQVLVVNFPNLVRFHSDSSLYGALSRPFPHE